MKRSKCIHCGRKITCKNRDNIQSILNNHYKDCKQLNKMKEING